MSGMDQAEVHPQTGSLVEIHRDESSLSISGQSRGLHNRWLLTRCHCCGDDFYTDRERPEPYCPTCMAVGR